MPPQHHTPPNPWQDSYLCQVRGVKRLLLWPDALLSALKPYPDDHPLARRLQQDILAPPPQGWETCPRLQSLCAPLEAVLTPGDVIFFPTGWSHHTEAALPDPSPSPGGEGSEPLSPTADDASFSLSFRTDGQFLL